MSATLEHALVNGLLVHASEQVGVDPKHRPAATCPVCDEAVTWKAGDVKVPHVAHLPSSTCPTSSPETMAHFSAKMRLAEMLASERAVPLSGLCSAGHFVRVVWSIGSWSRAVPEYRVGTRRPDVALLDENGDPVAAVEVFHTHAVDAEKAADLAAIGVPWIEVTSADALEWDGEACIAARGPSVTEDFDAACKRCPAPIEVLDAAYRAILARLPLDAGDREALLARGLTAEHITRGMYGTLHIRGRAAVAREVVDAIGETAAGRVPGIVWKVDPADPSRGWWSLAGSPGLVIPCRDLAGRIVALKIRRRDPCDGARYLYVTSAPAGGPKACASFHIPAAALALRGKVEPLVITVGEFNADVSTALSGLPVVSLSSAGNWRIGAELARAWGASRVAMALGADAREDVAVAHAQHELFRALRAAGFDVRLLTWPTEKGRNLDDLLCGARSGHGMVPA